MIWPVGGVAVAILAAVPASIEPVGIVVSLAVAAGIVAALGLAFRQVHLAAVGAILELLLFTIACWAAGGPAAPIRAIVFGLAAVLLLDASSFAARCHGATLDEGVFRGQLRYWLLRGLASIGLAAGLLAIGWSVAFVVPFWLAPALLAAGGVAALAAASRIAFRSPE